VELEMAWSASARVATGLLVAGLAAGAALLFVPLVDGSPLVSFTLDDAYITFRYAHNLAAGHGPVWNPGADPVEGYTTFLWVLLLGAADALGAGLEAASKVIAVLAAAATMGVLAFYGGPRPAWARAAAIGGLALSPAFALIVIQGMETALAGALAVAGAVALVAVVREPRPRAIAGLGLAALLGTLARPDLGLFFAVCIAGALGRFALARDGASVRRIAGVIALTFVVPGAAYFAWRWSYFGWPLPNTYYVKQSAGLVDSLGFRTVRDFVLRVAGPYLVIAAGLLVMRGRRGDRSPERIATWILLAAVGAFVAYGLTFFPLQGYLFRFQMPVYPVALLALVLAAGRPGDVALPVGRRVAAAAGAALAAALLVFPLNLLGETRMQVRGRWQYDRKEVGLALARYRHDGLSMLVTESGALPLYSGWRATDHLGLNDEDIAHHGVTLAHLRRLDPDLVMMSVPLGRPAAYAAMRRIPAFARLFALLGDGRHRLAAGIVKTSPKLVASSGQAHLYWLKTGIRDGAAITRTLRTLPTVRHLPARASQAIAADLGLAKTVPTGERV
jgi:hypothetical protein